MPITGHILTVRTRTGAFCLWSAHLSKDSAVWQAKIQLDAMGLKGYTISEVRPAELTVKEA